MITETEIYSGLQGIFESVFRRPNFQLTPELTAASVPGWDSFRFVSILVATEEYFGIKFLGPDIDDLKNVGDLARAVARKTSEAKA
ncbi:MAG TPA: acyl carrier protein [Chthoniobacterales bacterium]|nr:acyl carrier protein [Chthoniobacterales bacterium]